MNVSYFDAIFQIKKKKKNIKSKFQSCFYFNANVFIVCIPDPFSFTSCAKVKGAIFEKEEKEDQKRVIFCVTSFRPRICSVLEVEKVPENVNCMLSRKLVVYVVAAV